MPTDANKKLYNAGSEWQDEFGGIIDYYSTFFREYDPVIGRFNGVDPKADATVELSIYHYSGNNPVNFNDPMGDITGADLLGIIETLSSYAHGGSWSPRRGLMPFTSEAEALGSAIAHMNKFNAWGLREGWAQNADEALDRFNLAHPDEKILSYIFVPVKKTASGLVYNWGNTIYTPQNDPLKEFIAIVVGESSNNFWEAAGIASVMLNRLAHVKKTISGDFITEIGGKGQFDAIGGNAYNEILAMSWEEIYSPSNSYATRIKGALAGMRLWYGLPAGWSWFKWDVSLGAYFWNASTPQTGFNWNTYKKGVFSITTVLGETTFFRYFNQKKKWP